MKNPKWREVHPLNKKVKYNGKYLTTWSGYSMDLQQSPHGSATTTAKRFYEGDVVPFNITVDNKYRLKQLSAVSATSTGTSATVGDSNFTIKPIYEKYIFDLKLQQSTGGTISANKLTGTSGTNVSLSYTATGAYTFSNWVTTGGSVTNNTFKFGNTDATARAYFTQITPLKTFTYTNNNYAFTQLSSVSYLKGITFDYGSIIYDHCYAFHVKAKTKNTSINWLDKTRYISGRQHVGQSGSYSTYQYKPGSTTEKSWRAAGQYEWEVFTSNGGALHGAYDNGQVASSLMPIRVVTDTTENYGNTHTVYYTNGAVSADGPGYNEDFIAYPRSNWFRNWDLKYLVRQRNHEGSTAVSPSHSTTISCYVDNKFVFSAYGGLQMYQTRGYSFNFGFCSGVSGKTNSVYPVPGSASVILGVFASADESKAYSWLMAH